MLVHTTPGRTRLLNGCSRIIWNNVRFGSSESNHGTSNANFPSFSTKGDFQNFTKSPRMDTIASIVVHRTCSPPNSTLFSDKILRSSLIEGSLYAVETVTQTISKDTNLKTSNLTSQLTSDCLDRLEASLANLNSIDQIGIEKDDIFFAWLEKYDESKNTMRICTMSYPSYNQLKERNNELQVHMSKNDIIISNWDFVKVENDWKIRGMAMRKLGECTTKPFHWRWKDSV